MEKFSLRKVRMNGDYSRGKYFGKDDLPLWEYEGEILSPVYGDEMVLSGGNPYMERVQVGESKMFAHGHVRASARNGAKAEILKVFSTAKFYR